VKILFVEASAGQVLGGSLTGLLHLLAGLDRGLYDPVVVLYEDKPVSKELERGGVPVHIVHRRKLAKQHALQGSKTFEGAKRRAGLGSVLQIVRRVASFCLETLPSAFRLVPIMRGEHPDLVHVCNGFRGNLDAIVAARLCGIPCIVHAKGFDKFSFVERWWAGGTAAAICMTAAIRDHCQLAGLRPPEYHVFFDGIAPESFRPKRTADEVRAEFGIASDAPLVGVVGNIQPWKGQHVLVQAINGLLPEFPDLCGLIVGGVHSAGHEYAEGLRTQIKNFGLEGRVVLTGARDDVPDLMQAMTVVCHTSVRGEPFGRVIIEAMSVGRPVVATRAGGVPEFVAEGVDGLLVTPGDVAELEQALRSLLGDPEKLERLRAGAVAAAGRFGIDRQVEEVSALYEQIAGRAAVMS
jgi:glycosyltransferase involved in cell wall biosynthesis